MKKILVPTDFSEQADYAIEVAINIAKKSQAEVIVLHVVEDTTVTSVHYTGDLELPNMEDRLFVVRMIEKAKKELAELENKYKNIGLKTQLRIGNPYHNIKDYINDEHFDFVVMGTKGSTGFEEFLIGSNAEKVVRHAKCPVLTIHKKATNFDFKNIVYATALNEGEEQCVKVVKEFQEAYDAKIHLVRINTPNNFESDRLSLPALRKFAEKCNLKNYEVHVYNEASEEEGIIYFADYLNADLITMATHGRTGLAHLLTGSIAEDVVNHAKRPVMTFVIDK
ncbi:universal stress protein [Fulvivirga sp. RKSG066]|uniref:universal stress protein n=1 Tax=Fulvivirga aurantia TaxID=2529383 RepID=UPI0012BC8204|nr:universal stress protein [Fulvivirga aurantia]MTI20277.1 universal stress protein [Fulvivirga aurantia]